MREDDASEAAGSSINSEFDTCYTEPLFAGSSMTVGGAITMIMALVLRHGLTKLALDDILSLIHVLMPNLNLPRTCYLFLKILKTNQRKVIKHFYCNKCSVLNYLGTHIDVDRCSVCNADLRIEGNRSFFLVLPLYSGDGSLVFTDEHLVDLQLLFAARFGGCLEASSRSGAPYFGEYLPTGDGRMLAHGQPRSRRVTE